MRATPQGTLLITCLALFVLALIAWPVVLVVERRRSKASGQVRSWLHRLALWMGMLIALLNGIFAAGVKIIGISANLSPAVLGFMTLPVVKGLLAFGIVIFTVMVWKNHIWRLGGRLLYSLVTLATLAFVWFVNYWNLWVIGL